MAALSKTLKREIIRVASERCVLRPTLRKEQDRFNKAMSELQRIIAGNDLIEDALKLDELVKKIGSKANVYGMSQTSYCTFIFVDAGKEVEICMDSGVLNEVDASEIGDGQSVRLFNNASYPVNLSCTFSKSIPVDISCPFCVNAIQRLKNIAKIEEEIEDIESSITAVVNGSRTLKQLLDAWPEAAEIVKVIPEISLNNKVKKLPATTMKKVNSALGIESKEE